MELIVSQDVFSRALHACGKAVPSRASHPILTNVLISAKNNKVTVFCFDISFGIEITIPAEITTEGDTAVQHKLLAEIISKLPSDSPISLTKKDGLFIISSVSGTYELPTSDAEDFPDFPVVEGNAIELPSAELNRICRSVSFCASTDESKQILMGVNIKTEDGAIQCAATDGHRLAVNAFLLENADLTLNVTIPVTPLREIANLAGDVVQITESKHGQLLMQSDDIRMTAKSFLGKYPDVQQLIPPKFTTKALIDRKAFTQAIARVGTVAAMVSAGNNAIKISLDSNMMTIQADADGGKASEQLPMELNGKPLQIAVNAKYFLDALKALTCEKIELNCNSPITTVTIIDPDNYLSTYLVMPIQIRQ